MKFFISYRRDDTKEIARSIKIFLDQIPRIDEVFLDFDEIGVGVDFEERITDALNKSSHCLVLIGSNWSGQRDSAEDRIWDTKDFVRREVALSLKAKTKTIPILVDGTEMPNGEMLPEDLRILQTLNAFQFRTSHFKDDMNSLLTKLFGGSHWKRLTLKQVISRATIGLVAAGTFLFVGVITSNLFGSFPDSCANGIQCRLVQFFYIEPELARNIVVTGSILFLLMGALTPFLARIFRR